ncbi:MAG: hypothetical protein N2B02_05085, partial [Amylibacter sp.]
MLNTSMIRKAFCCATNKVGLLLVLAALCFFGNAASLWGQSVQRSVFLQRGPLPAQADPIPNQLWQQAMVYGQPINYQPQLGADASESVQSESMDGGVIEDFTDGSLAEDAFDPYGLVRVWANGVPSRVITSQRYSDAYWRFNIDLLALERHNLSEIRQYTNNTPPGATFKNAAPTGGMRISASADLFYSFDLEFAWLGNITWVGRPSNQFKWSAVNSNNGHNYVTDIGAGTTLDGVMIATRNNKTNFGSNLNAFEINTRFRWVGTTSPFTGAWILGVRYVRFTESAYVNNNRGDIIVQSSTIGAQQNTATAIRTEAANNLVGFQGGGEWFWSVFRGVMIGGNLKGGVYGNLAQNSSTIKDISSTTTSFGNASYEDSTTTGAFFGEANVMVNAHLGHNWY